MELRAYVEGYVRLLWLLLLIIPCSLEVGWLYVQGETATYTASTSILLNASILVDTAVPSTIVKLSVPTSYTAQVTAPPVLTAINKRYPRLSIARLKMAINVSADSANHILLIRVTDSKPKAAADIANYLALQFVAKQSASLQHELAYYQQWLQQAITHLTSEINALNEEIQTLQPPQTRPADHPVPSPQQRITLNTDQYTVNNDIRSLYLYRQALSDIQSVLPLFQKAYVIQHEAKVSDIPVVPPPAASSVLAIAAALGMLLHVVMVIVIDYFSPFLRHKGEIGRLTKIPILSDTLNISGFEYKQLQAGCPLRGSWGLDAFYSLCRSLERQTLKKSNHTILFTGLRQKRDYAALFATFLARSGCRTLLIEANHEHPSPLGQLLQIMEACNWRTDTGMPLSCIGRTSSPSLFVLPVNAMLTQNEPLTTVSLLALLPELQKLFQVIIIDGPSFDRSDARLLAPGVHQTILLLQKRRDRVKALKVAARQCQDVGLQVQCLWIS
jgi:capsular polysaccharide biosynthesis protein